MLLLVLVLPMAPRANDDVAAVALNLQPHRLRLQKTKISEVIKNFQYTHTLPVFLCRWIIDWKKC